MQWPPEPFAYAGLALGDSHAPPPGAAWGLDVMAQGCGLDVLERGAREHLLGDVGFLGSFFLVAGAGRGGSRPGAACLGARAPSWGGGGGGTS